LWAPGTWNRSCGLPGGAEHDEVWDPFKIPFTLWTRWTSVRKVKEGETTNHLFGFLTTEPNAEVKVIHPNAMPVILTTPAEVRHLAARSAGVGS
jgi:hypothetical protein